MGWYLVHPASEMESDKDVFQSNRERRVHHQRSNRRSYRANNGTIDRLSYHAQLRAAQRSLSPLDVVYILRHGRCYHAADAIFYFLGSRDIPKQDQHQMSRLVGTAVIVNKAHSTVITIWRNRQQGAHKIRRKVAASR